LPRALVATDALEDACPARHAPSDIACRGTRVFPSSQAVSNFVDNSDSAWLASMSDIGFFWCLLVYASIA
jgi:hypothetical protein